MILTCRSVILTVTGREEGRTPWTGRAEVWLHLRFCGECFRFVTQSAVVRTLLATASTDAAPVSADTKALLMNKFRAWHETRSPVQDAGLPPKKRA